MEGILKFHFTFTYVLVICRYLADCENNQSVGKCLLLNFPRLFV